MNFIAADTCALAELNSNNNFHHSLRRSTSLNSYHRSQEEKGRGHKTCLSNPNSRASSEDKKALGHLIAGIMGDSFDKHEVELPKMFAVDTTAKRLVLNISGKRYETYDRTLAKFPDSLLASPQREMFFDPTANEYFFDRNRKAFGAILTYCQTGALIKPPTLDERIFAAELRFFGFEEESEMHMPQAPEQPERLLPKNKHQRKVWELFEYPDTSLYARCIAIFSVSVIILSITMFCVETLPNFKEHDFKIVTDANGTVVSRTDKGERVKMEYAPIFNKIETFCIVWFTLEYLLRLASSPRKLHFLYQPLNLIDVVAILPFYVTLALNSVNTSVSSLSILRILRLVRVFRIFKLSRYSKGLKILGYTFKASLQELGLLAFFLLIGIVLFSSAAYYCEESVEGTKFKSIPHTFWWAIVTMTTVGYGDMTPETLGGKLVGSFCVLLGVLAIAFPVPVIVNNFTYYYTLEQGGPESLDEEYVCTPLGDRSKSDSSSCTEQAKLPKIVINKVNGKSISFEENGNEELQLLNKQHESNV